MARTPRKRNLSVSELNWVRAILMIKETVERTTRSNIPVELPKSEPASTGEPK